MGDFFVNLYNFFERHKVLLYLSLFGCVGIMTYFALQLKFEENITRFFPDTENEKNLNTVFNNLRVKDKIIVLFSASDTIQEVDNEDLIEAAVQFKDRLNAKAGEAYIDNIILKIDDSLKYEVQNFVYDNLPLFLTDSDYQRMDSLFIEGKINAIMQKNYSNLLSPASIVLKDYVMRDPLGLGGNTLKHLQDFQLDTNFEQQDGCIFTKDGKTLLMFITPKYGMGSTGQNDKLITAIEDEITSLQDISPLVKTEYFGGPSMGVYNARQIKEDSILTLTIALVIIIVFISLVFKEKKTIPLIITPVVFGGLFSLFMISILKESISSIAVGSGSIVLGIALSYSIHMVVHQGHVKTVQQLIKELTYPLTIGSFTTIGAFLGLLFTSSDLLRDFGLFASTTLIGTTIFCLVYLPHFLKGEIHEKKGKLYYLIERFNAYRFDKNKWLVGGVIVLTIICAFTSRSVGFDADMMRMNYEPEHLKGVEQKMISLVEGEKKTILFVSVGKDVEEATDNYNKTNRKLAELREQGFVNNFASANYFFIPHKLQQERLNRWNNYWTPQKKDLIKSAVNEESTKFHFRSGTFNNFYTWIDHDFSQQAESYRAGEEQAGGVLKEWQNTASDMVMLISQVQLDNENKAEVYSLFTDTNEIVIFDRAYFTEKWVSAINDDFYLVLFISSFLIFFTLLISYGRIELALISFLPMFVSWIIIIGIMGIIGMQFNIVNIILSTFIFGIGDDFSIFIMDGLQNKYKTGKSILNGHKNAIFFSAFMVIVGMGALVFAQHPALQSISVMSILGILVVVLVSYTIPPVVFRLLISRPTSKGFPPHSLFSLTVTTLFYLLFFIGCIFLHLVMFLLYLFPIGKRRKQKFMCLLISTTCRFVCFVAFVIDKEYINISKETFRKPSIIIANHQSFTDILFMLSLSPKLVMVTNHWVWKSPFFGAVIRYAGYLYIGEGWEKSTGQIQSSLDAGYSVVIFPEGTRSKDGNIKRFHKGAFYYAEKLGVDIIPVVLYGTGMIISKDQPLYMKRGKVVVKALPPIYNNDTSFGTTHRERTKKIALYFKNEYSKVFEEYNDAIKNQYFYNMLIKNYIYKGPVKEWYIRIKVKMEKNYRLFDELIPRTGQITDIGCGYGMLAYMLHMLSPDREIQGIDYDEDKIEIARHGFLNKGRIEFVHADATDYPLPSSDVFIMNDMLHYMNIESQQALLRKCAGSLHENGLILVRDANNADSRKQKMTNLSEIFSTRIFQFNKTKEELCFISADQMYALAADCGLSVESFRNDKYTSNTIFLLKKKSK